MRAVLVDVSYVAHTADLAQLAQRARRTWLVQIVIVRVARILRVFESTPSTKRQSMLVRSHRSRGSLRVEFRVTSSLSQCLQFRQALSKKGTALSFRAVCPPGASHSFLRYSSR